MDNAKIVGLYQYNTTDSKGTPVKRFAYIEENELEREFYIIDADNSEKVKEVMAKFARDKGYTKETLNDMTKDEDFKFNLSQEELYDILLNKYGFDDEIGIEKITETINEKSRFEKVKEKAIIILNKVKEKWNESKLVRRLTFGAGALALITALALTSCKTSKDNTPTSDGPKVVKPVDDDKDLNEKKEEQTKDEIKEEVIEEQENKTPSKNNTKNYSTNTNNNGDDKKLEYQDPNKQLDNKDENTNTNNSSSKEENVFESEEQENKNENYDQVIEVPTEDNIDFDDKYVNPDGSLNDAVDKDFGYEEGNDDEMPSPEENYNNIIEEEVPVQQSRNSNYANIIVAAMENGQDIIYNQDGTLSLGTSNVSNSRTI